MNRLKKQPSAGFKLGVLANYVNSTGKKSVLESFLINQKVNSIKKGISTQLFSCEVCKITKNTMFTEEF